MTIPSPAAGAMRRYAIPTLLLLLAPISGGFGLWLVFPTLLITGNARLSCLPQISFSTGMSPTILGQIVIGLFFFFFAILLFVSGLGVFASKDSLGAEKWLLWLGRFRSKLGHYGIASPSDSKYRIYAVLLLLAISVQAILLIPGIGESRQYALNQFATLFLGPVWYFYAMAILVSSLVLISFRRSGGYILGIMTSVIGFGTTIPDVLGFLPPSAPTLGTTVLAISVLRFALVLAFISWKALHTK